MYSYQQPVAASSQIGGTLQVTTLDLTNPFVFELRPGTFNKPGIWTLVSFISRTGNISNLTVDASATGFTAGPPYVLGNAVLVRLDRGGV